MRRNRNKFEDPSKYKEDANEREIPNRQAAVPESRTPVQPVNNVRISEHQKAKTAKDPIHRENKARTSQQQNEPKASGRGKI